MISFVRGLIVTLTMAGAFLAVAGPLPAVAQASQSGVAPAYPIAFTLAYDNRILGTPTLHLKEGNSAVVTVARQGGYALRATLGRQAINNRIMARVQLDIYRELDGKWLQVSTPTLILPFGGSTSFTLDRVGGGQPIFRLDMRMGQAVAAVEGKNTCTASKLADWQTGMGLPVSNMTGPVAFRQSSLADSGNC